MCEMCESAADSLKEDVLPGLHVVRAARDGEYFPKGFYGLVQVNNPMLYWSVDEGTDIKRNWKSYNGQFDRLWKKLRRHVMKYGVFGMRPEAFGFKTLPKGDKFATWLIWMVETFLFEVRGEEALYWYIDTNSMPYSAGSPLGQSVPWEEAAKQNEEFKLEQAKRKEVEDAKLLKK